MATIQMLSAALLMLLLVMGVSLGPLDSDTDTASAAQLTGEGAHHPQGRSATEERDKWHQCLRKECMEVTCSECGRNDKGCADMCRMNCECGCGGHPRGSMDHDMWEACNEESKCRGDFEVCRESCEGDHECVVRCELLHNQCYCGCMLTATQRKHNWDTCIVRSQCKEDLTCSECAPDDEGCADMCRMNCECGCGGHPRGGMDHDVWEACNQERECWHNFEGCRDSCEGEHECVARCELVHNKCYCECMHTALTTTQRKHKWDTCIVQSRCHNKTCSECSGADVLCAKRCARRCQCACAGHPRSDLSGEWEECFVGTQSCEQAHSACVEVCGDREECRHGCDLALVECRCVCRSATEAEWLMWTECKEEDEECEDKTCRECGEGDTDCAHRCQRNCECRRCLGIPADNMDDLSVQECKIKSGCHIAYKKCQEKCKAAEGDEECDHSCLLASEKCHCKCAQTSATERRESEGREIIQHCNYLS